MAAFVAKQMMGNKLSAVKGQMAGEGEGSAEDREAAAEEEQERLEALREAEERRKEKHKKMEEEREKMRQGIRDKYGIKKKEEEEEEPLPESSSLNRKKKTPAEIEAEDLDDFTRWRNNIEIQLGELRQTIESKCVIQ
ncbi:complexin-like isoform X1 [Argiope bruennichi]|uniref:complexin-like isoform X1 n=2 Tax=Argiope bruennichi TaxID=94029 RepID=UPI0024951A32|nr:complexin-like isoform X1 [Argiope bruennichi]XP_055927108.1 complexin-like isoform X1 [Argiope bruennichi]